MTPPGLTALDGTARRRRLDAARLYLCTPDRPDLIEFVGRVCAAGVDVVQLREKDATDRVLIERAAAARETTHLHGGLFVLNDRPDLAFACDADGVHVGQDDVPPSVCREVLGPEAIVGLSTHAPAELDLAADEPVDYVSVGPVAETPTKPGRSGTGLEYVTYAAAHSAHPFFVTGGVDDETLPSIAAAGATRFVVVRALTGATDPAAAAQALRTLIDG